MKAIETRYKGYRFRSRLEARWAVFFDKACVDFTYEPEGYSLPSGNYLPDFCLYYDDCAPAGAPAEVLRLCNFKGHTYRMFVEIKPTAPTSHEINLCRELSEATSIPCIILDGTVNNFSITDFTDGANARHPLWRSVAILSAQCMLRCKTGGYTWNFMMRESGVCKPEWSLQEIVNSAVEWASVPVQAAMAARFEHGENL